MGDFQNMKRDLAKLRELRRKDDWRGIGLEIVCWLVVIGFVFGMLKWLLP